MRQPFKMKLLAGLFVPALAFAAGTAYATGTDKMKGDASANATTTTPAAPSGSMNNGMKSGPGGVAARFARLDTNHDGKLSSSEVAADPNVQAMWKNLDA